MKSESVIVLEGLIDQKENQIKKISEDIKILRRALEVLSENNVPASLDSKAGKQIKNNGTHNDAGKNPYKTDSIPYLAFEILKEADSPLSNRGIFEEFEKRGSTYGKDSIVNNLYRETKNNRSIVKTKDGFGIKEWLNKK